MYITANDAETFAAELTKITTDDDQRLIIFVAAESREHVPALLDKLRAAKVNFAGGVFPSVIHNSEVKSAGLVATVLPTLSDPIVIQGVGEAALPEDAFAILKDKIETAEDKPLCLMLATNSIEQTPLLANVAELVYDSLGETVSYIGGGAGDGSLAHGQSVFHNDGFYNDAVLVVPINKSNRVDAEYGWQPAGTFFIATKTQGNVISELNRQPALDVFRQEFQKVMGEPIAAEDVGLGSALHLGMSVGRQEMVMRAILATTPDGSLVVGGSVPEKSLLTLMKATPQKIAQKTRTMTHRVKRSGNKIDTAIIVECITRPPLMQEVFDEELTAIAEILGEMNDSIGFVALGEFGQVNPNAKLELLNESIVLAATF